MSPAARHILYVQERFPVLSETFVTSEIKQLRLWNVLVSVATTRAPALWWRPTAQLVSGSGSRLGATLSSHVEWLVTAPRRYFSFLGVVLRAPLKDKPFVMLAPSIARTARDEGITHVHTHFAFRAASVARGVAALLDCPRSVTTHANDIFVRRDELKARLRGAEVLTISQYNQDVLRHRGIPSQVNHCGVDVDRLSHTSGDGERDDGDNPDVVFVGRLVAKKGPLQLVAAIRELQRLHAAPVRVTVVGEGPLRLQCEALTAAHGLPITFLGATSPERTLSLIASARVLCLPCQEAEDGDVDGIPVVLMEAMALGTPVVSTRVSGIPELVSDDTGWLVDPGADGLPLRIAQSLSEVLGDGADRAARVQRARAHIDAAFTLEAQARGVLHLAKEQAPT